MDKFGRNYSLDIQVSRGGPIITIEPPFTLQFDVTRNSLPSSNVSQFRIYNLSKVNRDKIRKNALDFTDYRSVIFRAGYGEELPVIFAGSVSSAWNVREDTNMITQLESYDGGFAFVNGLTNRSFPAGTDQREIIRALFAGLPNISAGAVGDFKGATSKDTVFNGNTQEILNELTGGAFFVDNGKAHALKTNEVLADAPVLVISPASGLLGTPQLEQGIVHFDMIFEPSLAIAQEIRLESFTEQNFNGSYKVTSVKHRGIISDSVCGSAVTSAQFVFNGNVSRVR